MTNYWKSPILAMLHTNIKLTKKLRETNRQAYLTINNQEKCTN